MSIQEKHLYSYRTPQGAGYTEGMKVTLTHWTHKRNVASILKRGLLTRYATGKRQAVWFCSMEHMEWAIEHVAARHGWKPEDVVAVEINAVPSRTLRHSRPGVFFTCRDIPPSDVSGVCYLTAGE